MTNPPDYPYRPPLRLNPLAVRSQLHDCIAGAVALGYRRAHKHTDAPDEQAVCDRIEEAVCSVLDEWLLWGEES